MASETVLTQVWLGLKPYVLIEMDLKSVEMDGDEVASFNSTMQFGGGFSQEDAYDFLDVIAAQRPEPSE